VSSPSAIVPRKISPTTHAGGTLIRKIETASGSVNPAARDFVYTGRMEYAATSQLMTGIAGNVAVDIRNFESILRLYKPKVFRFLLASLREKDIAETLTQDCFFKAYQARERFREECSIETWLMKIAVNLVRDYSRNRRLQFWRRTQLAAILHDVTMELL